MNSLLLTKPFPETAHMIRKLAVLTLLSIFHMMICHGTYAHAGSKGRADYLRAKYWEDVVSDTSLPYLQRISGIDSLISHGNHDSPQLIRQKARLLSDQGNRIGIYKNYKDLGIIKSTWS